MSYKKQDLNSVKNIIHSIRNDSKELSKKLEKKIQDEVINVLANSLFTEEGYNYITGFAANMEDLSNEIAIGANDTINSVTKAYDQWLRSAKNSDNEEEAENASSMWYINFQPSEETKWTVPKNTSVKELTYKYSSGGDSREYSYLSSNETKIKINTSEVYPVTQDNAMATGADTDGLETVINSIELIKEDIKSTIHSYQNDIKSQASSIDRSSNITNATGSYYDNMLKSFDGIFDYLSDGKDSSTGMKKKLLEIIEKYKYTIPGKVARDLNEETEELY